MKGAKGFSLAEVAITLSILAITIIALAGWQVNEYKHNKAREIAGVLLAIDGGYYQASLVYNGTIPGQYCSNVTSETDETCYVQILRNGYNGVSFLDPRINLKALARSGYRFTFNINGNRLDSITVLGLEEEHKKVLSAILGDRWNNQTNTYKLNAGYGYNYSYSYGNSGSACDVGATCD